MQVTRNLYKTEMVLAPFMQACLGCCWLRDTFSIRGRRRFLCFLSFLDLSFFVLLFFFC